MQRSKIAPSQTGAQPIRVTRDQGRAFGVAATFLLVAAGQAAVVLALNAAVDPRAELGTGWFQPLVSPEEYGEKEERFLELPEAPRTLVLGSSRVMKVAPSDVAEQGHGPAFNFGLSSSTAKDVLSTYERVSELRGAPREIIIGIEPDQLIQGRRERWVEEAADGPFDRIKTLGSTYSLKYTFDSLLVIRYTITGYPPKLVSMDPDGLLHYVDWESRSPRPPPNEDALMVARGIGFDEMLIDETQVEALRSLVRTARYDGVEVHLFMTPLYPAERLRLEERADYLAARARTAEILQEFCGEGVTLHDFEDIAAFNGIPTDFRDFVHYGPDNARRLVVALYATPGSCA